MKKIVVVNVDHWEIQVAVLMDGRLDEFHITRTNEVRSVGNIYKGKVTSVLTGIQAAFVDVGEDRNGFLYVSELPDLPSNVEGEDLPPRRSPLFWKRRKPDSGIEDRLKAGDEVLVQVTKDAIGKKGCRLTTRLSLPGRFMVLMPHMGKVGVSKRIPDARDRQRLREIAKKICPRQAGIIVRTAGEGKDKDDLKGDVKYLMKLWKTIDADTKTATSPALIHRDLDLKMRVIRDLVASDIDQVIVNSEEHHTEMVEFCRAIAPEFVDRIQHHKGKEPLLEHFSITQQLDRAMLKRVPLESGGSVIIEKTEALTSVDVNSGSSVDQKNLEETAYQTNLEAADEICRQIRIRNLGGIIIIDFIDMMMHENKKKLIRHLHQAARKDKAPYNITEISELGLVEMTRKRDKRSLQSTVTASCSYCSGTGRVKSQMTMSIEIQRRLDAIFAGGKKRVLVKAHPLVASRLLNEDRANLIALEDERGTTIVVEPEETMHIEEAKFYSVESMQLIESIKTAKPIRRRTPPKDKPERQEDAPRKRPSGNRRGRRRGRPRNPRTGQTQDGNQQKKPSGQEPAKPRNRRPQDRPPQQPKRDEK